MHGPLNVKLIWKFYLAEVVIFRVIFRVHQVRDLFHVEFEQQMKNTIGNKFIKTMYLYV